jgi:tRNA (mo5U34)-methyltransferase
MAFTKDELEAMARSVPLWWHSIDFGQGVVTDGQQSPALLASRVESLQLPDLRGKRVLDIGAFDGFYSFEAERRGAAHVVSLDHYVWSLDLPAHIKYWEQCRDGGLVPAPYHETPEWRPSELPGKRGYDTAHRALSSRAEAIVGDFMTMDLAKIGTFDVVLFLGVLYHMTDPVGAMRRVEALTRDLAIVETTAVHVPGYEKTALCEFYESNELNADVSNWWSPNTHALEGLCRAAGFRRVRTLVEAPRRSAAARMKSLTKHALAELALKKTKAYSQHPIRYRTVAHAWK